MRHAMVRAVFGILAVVLVSGAARAQRLPAVAAAKDAATLVGTWRAVSLEANGTVAAADDVRKITVVNAGDGGWTVYAEGRVVAKGTNELLPWSVPKGIDFVVTEDADGPRGDGQRQLGIYELEQNTRRLCFAPPGADRPTSFASPPGSGLVLVTFERVAD